MPKRTPGLHQRGQIWWIDKVIHGHRIRASTGSRDRAEAEAILADRIREVQISGDGQHDFYRHASSRQCAEVTFETAAARYLMEHQHNRAIRREADALAFVMPFVGHLPLSRVHSGTLQPFVRSRLASGVCQGTVNRDLCPVRRVLTLSARLWRDESGEPWLRHEPPLIQMGRHEARKPHILTWSEQRRLLAELPRHLADMALFKLNTGTREREVVNLRWDWEVRGHHAFLIPASYVKNKLERLVACNSVAWKVIKSVRGTHPEQVFTYRGKPVTKMYNTAWRRARKRADLPDLRVHDLKHTFGFRLRAASVDSTDLKDLLGHKNSDITRHYSVPDVERLLEQAEKVVGLQRDPVLRVVGAASGGRLSA